MTPEAQKWRDHFINCERDQLQRFPLCQNPLQQLETPLLRAQFEVAFSDFQQKFPSDVLRLVNERMKNDANFPRFESYRKVTAFRADHATREAFYEHFAKEPLEDFFCIRTE
ncbi:hypothetical protein EON83_18805 [bacterium]|nr:MAG: hypothetical protein EON83_18805 [bacterium]